MGILRAVRELMTPAASPRVQILSDLHLEVGQQYSSYTFPATAPFLLLGGDIGRLIDYDAYLQFLGAQVSRYKKVFLVLGNHEAHWDDPDSGLTVVGCTLWSAIPEDVYEVVRAKVSDFKKIPGWTPQRHNQVHAEEVAWLRERVASIAAADDGRGRRLLVATHHAPCVEGSSSPAHASNPWTPAFATDIIQEGEWEGVKAWAFGHTHYSTTFMRNGIKLIANQRGYVLPGSAAQKDGDKKRKGAHEFDAHRFITV
ncbi:ser/thr protein phosphatase superfamily [Purpureocillium lilacinum]|uniref:Ser/thr protein phosphatase superfamily n=1 Tax=Purpureocillium lilacinum TaxID=33203 RepID=A0A179HHF2_PURLI|nr:ser/thr protein phosphatase superfamily [Purpureocillium lilacinum]OAQ88890.1 ser/thr protein phosphatase superfamily [Purpureocillium lilacinum]